MIDYNTIPQCLKDGYDRRGKREGLTGEQYFIKGQKEKAIYKRSLFEGKTREEISDHLSDVLLHLTDIADYLDIIDSPYAQEASKIEGDFLNFISAFAVVGESEREAGWKWKEVDFCGRQINES